MADERSKPGQDENLKPGADGKPKPRVKADDEITGKAYDTRLMLRLARYLKPYRTQATISVVAVMLRAATDAAGP